MNMKALNITIAERILMSMAFITGAIPFIVKHYHPITDGLAGFIVGAGLGIETVILIRIRRRKNKLA